MSVLISREPFPVGSLAQTKFKGFVWWKKPLYLYDVDGPLGTDISDHAFVDTDRLILLYIG
jgi:hypothetical protein